MSGDIFGNLREWGHIPEQLEQLTKAGALDEHQEGLIRLLRYRDNWRLREMALEAVRHLRSPEDKLLSEVLGVVTDDGLYCEVRIFAAKSLSALLAENAAQCRHDGRSILCRVIQEIRMLLDSPQPPVIQEALRECLAELDQDGRASCAPLASPGRCGTG
jgi:hypothetical protein